MLPPNDASKTCWKAFHDSTHSRALRTMRGERKQPMWSCAEPYRSQMIPMGAAKTGKAGNVKNVCSYICQVALGEPSLTSFLASSIYLWYHKPYILVLGINLNINIHAIDRTDEVFGSREAPSVMDSNIIFLRVFPEIRLQVRWLPLLF